MSPINTRQFGKSLLRDLRQPRGYLSVLVLVIATQAPVLFISEVLHILILTYIIGVAAIGWNIIGGFGGQFSLGNSMFFGAAAYTFGLLLVNFNFGFVPAFALGLVVVVGVALLVGYPSFQLTGHYFALATITVVEAFRFLVRYFNQSTGGAQGFSLVPALTRGVAILDLSRTAYYFMALGLFVSAFLVSVWVRRSRVGHYLMALRDDQLAAASVGINVARYKMFGWLITAVLTGLAGMLYAMYIQYLTPAFSFSITQSVLYAVIPIIGGIGTLSGPVIGALLMVPLQEIAEVQFGGQFGAVTYVIYGIVLILLILYAPDGLRPKLKRLVDPILGKLPTFGEEPTPNEPDPDEIGASDD